MARALNRKQLAFVEKYLEGVRSGTPNGTSAYVAAFQCRSRDAARSAAARLLKDVRVQELLHPAREAAEVARVEQVASIEITRDRIRLELARLSFFDPRRLFREDGTLKPVRELDADTAAALAQFDVVETFQEGKDGEPGTVVRTTKYKMWDKLAALKTLADTEPGVWAEDAKGSGPTTNVSVEVNARLMTLTADDVLAVDQLLASAGAKQAAGKAAVPLEPLEPKPPG